MWNYERRLQYPIRIKNPDARADKIIITQYGGPDGSMGHMHSLFLPRFR